MTASDVGGDANDVTAHNAVTLALAKKEIGEHMEGMAELYKKLRSRSLTVKAYAVDDPRAPSEPTNSNVKTVHFLRHGQGQLRFESSACVIR